MLEHIRTALVPIHHEGYRFIALFAVATLVLFSLWEPLGWIGVVLTLWCAYFFRDPPRVTPVREGLVVSPADGLVLSVSEAAPPVELGMDLTRRTRISIFMNVFDPHINRIPADGEITALVYRPGKFVNASFDKASTDNERQCIRMTTADGKDIAFVQIAGLVARRIVCTLYEGQRVQAGERFGMIRFGSRLDVYLDQGQTPMVVPGQTALAGETVLADGQAGEPRREGEER